MKERSHCDCFWFVSRRERGREGKKKTASRYSGTTKTTNCFKQPHAHALASVGLQVRSCRGASVESDTRLRPCKQNGPKTKAKGFQWLLSCFLFYYCQSLWQQLRVYVLSPAGWIPDRFPSGGGKGQGRYLENVFLTSLLSGSCTT